MPLQPPLEAHLTTWHKNKDIYRPKKFEQLRGLVARHVAGKMKNDLDREWADEKFRRWLEDHPYLLENYLLAIDPRYDDILASLRIMKRLWKLSPGKTAEFPDLAIALAVVWDKPGKPLFEATDPPTTADVYDNYAFYTSEKTPVHRRIKQLPWELLCYVVANKASAAERRWILENYSNKVAMIGNAYFDVAWKPNSEELVNDYTVPNMKRLGGVCTTQADYALLLSRTMGVPAFYGWPGFPKYYGGHAWLMWLEIKGVESGRIRYTLESIGRYGDRKDYTSVSPSPHIGIHEDEGILFMRFHRLGKDIQAYRHAELLMRCYPLLAESAKWPLSERLRFLAAINDLSPGCEKAWREIAAFGSKQEAGFTKKDVGTVVQLFDRMLDEFSASPNALPSLTATMLAFPEIKTREKALYDKLLKRLALLKRPDLFFEATKNLSKSLSEQNKKSEAASLLAKTALTYHEEISNIDPVLDLLEQTVQGDKKLESQMSQFYVAFFGKVLDEKVGVPMDYRKDMFKRGNAWFNKIGDRESPKKILGMTSIFGKK